MGAVVGFDYAAWLNLFPEFSYVSSAQALLYFNIATTAHRNDINGPVDDAAKQLQFLNIVTAHIAALFAPKQPGGDPANPLVGRIASASEGSVSVSADFSGLGQSAAWWSQTRYGAMYWQLTKPYRNATVVLGPRRIFEPWPFGLTGGPPFFR